LLLLAFLFLARAHAQTITTPATPASSLQAFQALAKNDWQRAQGIIAKSPDPLDIRLYYWFYLRSAKATSAGYIKLVQFIRANPDWPEISTLRLRAEAYMPANLPATDYVHWFDDY